MPLPHTFANQSGNVPASWLDDNFNALVLNGPWPAGTVLGNVGPSPGNVGPVSASQLYGLLKPVIPFEIAPFMGGVQGAGTPYYVFRYQPSTNLILVQAQCYAGAGTAFTAAATFNILDNGTVIGTVVFAAGSASGAVTFTTNPYNFPAGHTFAIQAPATADTTGADVNITISGQRA
jgi:hypothetical protein